MDSCTDHDSVLVGPGIYYENIFWPNTLGINLISEYGPDSTIIDGQSYCRVIQINPIGVDSLGMINGFTIRNGYIDGYGAGILCLADRFTISGNIITNNHGGFGGGIGCFDYGNPIRVNIINNIIARNYAGDGGGICCRGTGTAIINNTINRNKATKGGGIFCQAYALIRGNIITEDTATAEGGGIRVDQCSPLIIDNIISENVLVWITHDGAGISLWNHSNAYIESCTISDNYGVGVYCKANAYPTLHYNNITGNTYYGVQNINTAFINAEYNWWGDSTGPYHPDSNPGGLGDSVSDYVDFIPWLYWPGVEERPYGNSAVKQSVISSTVFAGPLQLPKGQQCRVFDITGRVVIPDKIKPGIYFIELDGKVVEKVVKVR